MGVLNDALMEILQGFQQQVPVPVCMGMDGIDRDMDFLGCRASCSGDCDDSCAGGCEGSCAGSCDDSCSGSCEHSASFE